MTTNSSGTQIDEAVLAAVLDRLIPAVDDLPAAGQMDLTAEIIGMAGQQSRFQGIFTDAVNKFDSQNPSFISQGGDEQDNAIRAFETGMSSTVGLSLIRMNGVNSNTFCIVPHFLDQILH